MTERVSASASSRASSLQASNAFASAGAASPEEFYDLSTMDLEPENQCARARRRFMRHRLAVASFHPVWRGPIGPTDAKADRFWPAASFDATSGRLSACYYDTSGDAVRGRAWYSCTSSRDGRRWAEPVRVARDAASADVLWEDARVSRSATRSATADRRRSPRRAVRFTRTGSTRAISAVGGKRFSPQRFPNCLFMRRGV